VTRADVQATAVSVVLTGAWGTTVLLGVYYRSIPVLVVAVVVGLSASLQLAKRKGYPAWLAVFATFIGVGPLLMWAVPMLKSSGPRSE